MPNNINQIPAQINLLLQRSIEQLQVGNLELAENYVKQVLAIQSAHFDGLHIFGVIRSMQGNFDDSVKLLKAAVEINKSDFSVQFNLAKALMDAGNHLESLHHHREAHNLNPLNIDCLINYAKSLKESGQELDALTAYDKALEINPAEFEVWTYRGIILNELGRHDEAIQSFDCALKINPNFVSALLSKGVTFFDLENYDQAIVYFKEALTIDPTNQSTWLNMGQAYHEIKQFKQALAAYGEAHTLNPRLYDAEFLESLTALTLGNFDVGLKKFEARFLKTNAPQNLHPELPAIKNLQQVPGKVILVWEEEGFGDAIQFSRYISKLSELGAKVVFEVRPELLGLFDDFGGVTVIQRGQRFEGLDMQVPLQSLPFLFSERITTIPNSEGYLSISSALIEKWAGRLSLNKKRLNIGVATYMNPRHVNSPIAKKIMPLILLEPLLKKANLFVLQKNIPELDRDFVKKHPEIKYLGDEIEDFSDSAAIIKNMDLIISVDTSIAHLAGALGKKVFILLSWSSDWRWFLDSSQTPWYSEARLFRQKTAGNWLHPLNEVLDALKINS